MINSKRFWGEAVLDAVSPILFRKLALRFFCKKYASGKNRKRKEAGANQSMRAWSCSTSNL